MANSKDRVFWNTIIDAINNSVVTDSYSPEILGNRIKNLSGTVTKAYRYDGPRPPRADSNRTGHTAYNPGALITETIYLNDTPIAAIKAAGAYFIQADHLNTPRAILGTSNGASPRIQAARGMRRFQKKITGTTAIP